MRYTFNLKEPKKDGDTLILFSSYFKKENKKFVYSTGEVIHPENWDFKNIQPKHLNSRTSNAEKFRVIKRQLDRYSNFFIDTVNLYKLSNREIFISSVKKEFDKEFKKAKPISNKFFEVYDTFLKYKTNNHTDLGSSTSTIKRYKTNKNLLLEYQNFSKSKLNFNFINESFYNSFIEFCVNEKRHSANTLRRNVGLLKTFLYWAYENKFTYKTDFQKFIKPKSQPTNEIALTLAQVKEVFDFELQNKRLEKVRDLFVFGCATGLRISNFSKVQKKDIENGHIRVIDKKNNDKSLSIPLNEFSLQILEKYNYKLPVITNQKFNLYIKEVFKLIGFDYEVKKTSRIGKEIIENIVPFYDRISSHTARRSFITIMKNNKIPDKIIMSFTGHKSLEVFNKYYKPNDDDKKEFMNQVWKL